MANKKDDKDEVYNGMPKKAPVEMNSMQKGLQALLGKDHGFSTTLSTPTAPNINAKGLMYQQRFADGGMVSPMQDPLINGGFMMPGGPAAQQPVMPPPAMHPQPADIDAGTPTNGIDHSDDASALQRASAALPGIPATNPNIYQGMTAEDRLAMQQQLMKQMNSGPSLAANAVAGLGDAISNSYGGKNNTFQKGVMENQQKQMDNRLGGIDTARAQKLQDIEGNQQAQLSDPNSALSQSMRKTLQSAGLKVPSGMSGEVMLKIAGPLGELAMKQATLGVQQQQVNASQANAAATRREEAAKALGERGIIRKGLDMFDSTKSDETKVLQDELHETNGNKPGNAAPHGIPDLGSTFNGQKVLGVKRIS